MKPDADADRQRMPRVFGRGAAARRQAFVPSKQMESRCHIKHTDWGFVY